MKCPTCGTENDGANRFCDQCGSRLDVAAAAPSAEAALAAQPTAAAATCPSCGAVVLPGEAFCDECGASLSGVAAPPVAGSASYDAPTVYAPPMPSGGASAAPAGAAGTTCSACGHQNLPEDRYCDNCGAALASAGTPQPAEAPTAEPSQPPEAPPAEPPAATTEPPTATTEPPAAEAPQKAASSDMPTAEQPALPSDAAYQAEKQRLEEEIARQQQIIAQFEQMQTMFGAAVPPAVTQGLAEARDAQARAQADLQALAGGVTAAPAPVETAPAAVEAPAPAPEPQAPAPAPEEVAAPPEPAAPAVEPLVPVPVNVPAPEPPPSPAPPQPAAAPRLILDEGGKELPLPIDKTEIIVGREDPISGIFPEIDLTPYGGEGGGVSRQHARISRSNGQWTITDLNSTNYTRVDGNKLDPSLPAPIKDGARIQFGRIAATFRE